MLRSALAVVAGYLTMMIGVTTFFAFVMMVILGGRPDDPKSFHAPAWLYVLELVVTPVLAGLGGYVCAWIARRKQLRHALVLVGVMIAMGIVTLVTEDGLKPLWSTLAVIVLGAAAVPLGARVRMAHEAAIA
jgi:hypothetical protein